MTTKAKATPGCTHMRSDWSCVAHDWFDSTVPCPTCAAAAPAMREALAGCYEVLCKLNQTARINGAVESQKYSQMAIDEARAALALADGGEDKRS